MDWVDKLALSTYSRLPISEPRYWRHPLVHSIGLPKDFPLNLHQEDINTKAFVLFLDYFDPPENFEGLEHQLLPLQFNIKEGIKNAKVIGKDSFFALERFIELIEDYILLCPKDEREVLKANKLHDIQKIGIWRFHFHCSQVVRDKIDYALNIDLDSKQEVMIRVADLSYLKDGKLDPLYEVMSFELHKDLKRKRYLSLENNSQEVTPEKDTIYNLVLSCEHCIHLAHHVVESYYSYEEKNLVSVFKKELRGVSRAGEKSLEDKYDERSLKIVKKLMTHIKSVNRLIDKPGAVPKGQKRTRRAEYVRRQKLKKSRLLPIAKFEEIAEESFEQESDLGLDSLLDLLNGINDDDGTGLLIRRYGNRPQIPSNSGEDKGDYKKTDYCEVPASWLVNPYMFALKLAVQAESLILNQDPPIWNSNCLMIGTIMDCFKVIDKRELDLKLLVLIMFHTGLSIGKISQLRVGVPEVFLKLQDIGKLSTEEFTYWNKVKESLEGPFIDPDSGDLISFLPGVSVS